MPEVKEDKAPHGRSIAITQDGDSYSVADKPTDHAKVRVTVQNVPAGSHVQLPNGRPYAQGETAILTIEELDQIDPAMFTGGGAAILTNDGFLDAIQSEGTIKSIAVAGADADDSISATGPQTNQYTATVTYMNGDTEAFDETNSAAAGVQWASSDEAVATIDTAGLATAVATGTTVITATFRGVTGTAPTLTVVA